MKFFSKERQDEFAYYLIGKSGLFLDVGSQHPYDGNNTQALELIGWKGVLIEKRQRYVNLCKLLRKSPTFCIDASGHEFAKLIRDNFPNKVIDYISLDIDQWSVSALKQVLNSEVDFKCMTFEHSADFGEDALDEYGKDMKTTSKNILENKGFFPLFENVKLSDGKVWEDWWINPKYFPDDILKISKNFAYYDECINALKKYYEKSGKE